VALPPHASVLANADVWMESEAVEQLARTAGKPGCVRAVGMPDLHPGRGIPIGAVFLFDGRVFPELVGGDAGCGVLLIAGRKDGPRGDALERRVLAALDEPMLPDVDPAALVACAWERGPRGLAALSGVPEALGELALRAPDDAHERASGALPDGTRHAEQLGTVGGGNHFAEISRVDQLHGISLAMTVASAQVKSALLLAGLHAAGTTRVIEPAVTRDHTERMLCAFGVDIEVSGLEASVAGGQQLTATEIAVPGDFSSAAFFIVAGLLGRAGPVLIRNVGLNPTRTGLLDILRAMGADIRVLDRRELGGEPVADLEVFPSELQAIAVPERWVSLAIDEFPIFFIAAACAQGQSELRGAEELRVKESDRLAVMSEGLRALGVEHQLLPDGIRISGAGRANVAFNGGRVDSHGDHRIAMSFAVASLRAGGPIVVDDVANVATSFPGFAALARQVGIKLEEGVPAHGG